MDLEIAREELALLKREKAQLLEEIELLRGQVSSKERSGIADEIKKKDLIGSRVLLAGLIDAQGGLTRCKNSIEMAMRNLRESLGKASYSKRRVENEGFSMERLERKFRDDPSGAILEMSELLAILSHELLEEAEIVKKHSKEIAIELDVQEQRTRRIQSRLNELWAWKEEVNEKVPSNFEGRGAREELAALTGKFQEVKRLAGKETHFNERANKGSREILSSKIDFRSGKASDASQPRLLSDGYALDGSVRGQRRARSPKESAIIQETASETLQKRSRMPRNESSRYFTMKRTMEEGLPGKNSSSAANF
jgi:hypothetical protein